MRAHGSIEMKGIREFIGMAKGLVSGSDVATVSPNRNGVTLKPVERLEMWAEVRSGRGFAECFSGQLTCNLVQKVLRTFFVSHGVLGSCKPDCTAKCR